MNYNDRKNSELEMDEWNIKSHLNTSLDLSGINVSEDLINRTLAVIKEQPAENKEQQSDSKEFNKKIIPWSRYVRGFAGVAAAVLIVAVGYNVITQVPMGSQKNASNDMAAPEQSIYGTMSDESEEQSFSTAATEEKAKGEDAGMASSEIGIGSDVLKESTVQYTITADALTKADGGEVTVSESEDGRAEAGSTEIDQPKVSASLRNSNGIVLFTFREIFLPNPVTAEYITITDEMNKASITLTDQAEILDFYTVMDAHRFTNSTVNTTDQSYTVELKRPQPEALYTLFVGENLTVRYVEGDAMVESIYDAVDKELLKQNLEELYQKYSE